MPIISSLFHELDLKSFEKKINYQIRFLLNKAPNVITGNSPLDSDTSPTDNHQPLNFQLTIYST